MFEIIEMPLALFMIFLSLAVLLGGALVQHLHNKEDTDVPALHKGPRMPYPEPPVFDSASAFKIAANKIMSDIRKASGKGQFSLYVPEVLTEDAKAYFERYQYKVKLAVGGYIILWAPERLLVAKDFFKKK